MEPNRKTSFGFVSPFVDTLVYVVAMLIFFSVIWIFFMSIKYGKRVEISREFLFAGL